MRSMVLGAVGDARAIVKDVFQDAIDLDDDVVLTKYVREHKGDERALINFTRQTMPEGADVFTEAFRYREEMEKLLKKSRGGV